MPTLTEDIQSSAQWIASALTASGYQADFSLRSLKEVDRFMDEHSRAGQAIPEGLLADQLGAKMFALGGYVGEAIRRQRGGDWKAPDDNADDEINVSLTIPDGSIVWPVQRVMKRFQNGAEDGIYAYAVSLGLQETTGAKPWWKVW